MMIPRHNATTPKQELKDSGTHPLGTATAAPPCPGRSAAGGCTPPRSRRRGRRTVRPCGGGGVAVLGKLRMATDATAWGRKQQLIGVFVRNYVLGNKAVTERRWGVAGSALLPAARRGGRAAALLNGKKNA